MKKSISFLLLALIFALGLVITACGSEATSDDGMGGITRYDMGNGIVCFKVGQSKRSQPLALSCVDQTPVIR